MKQLQIPKPGNHCITPRLLSGRVNVSLVGAGGNGSQMLSGLARLHMTLLKTGHPGGLKVTVWDFDTVSESNIGRQLFFPSDIGQMKSFVLVNRFNLCYGFDWLAEGDKYESDGADHIVISCVDTAKARREIRAQIWDKSRKTPDYWLDLGNRQREGQTILGQPKGKTPYFKLRESQKFGKSAEEIRELEQELSPKRLPCVTDVFPELLDESIPEDNTPSCSLAEALQKQDLFINQQVATSSMVILTKLFREGKIQHHGAFIDLESGRVNPLPVPSHIKPRISKK